jgi:hypothetical protein
MLAVWGSVRQNTVNVPGVVSIYDRPNCLLLSFKTAYVRELQITEGALHRLSEVGSTARLRARDYAKSEDLLGLGDCISVDEALV